MEAVAPTTDNVLIAIAQKKDFFRKRGIEAELISLRDSIDSYGAHEQETIEISPDLFFDGTLLDEFNEK